MKTNYSLFNLFFCVVLGLFTVSCSSGLITKRKHRKGYHWETVFNAEKKRQMEQKSMKNKECVTYNDSIQKETLALAEAATTDDNLTEKQSDDFSSSINLLSESRFDTNTNKARTYILEDKNEPRDNEIGLEDKEEDADSDTSLFSLILNWGVKLLVLLLIFGVSAFLYFIGVYFLVGWGAFTWSAIGFFLSFVVFYFGTFCVGAISVFVFLSRFGEKFWKWKPIK